MLSYKYFCGSGIWEWRSWVAQAQDISCSSSQDVWRAADGKEPACQCRRHKRCGFDPWVRKIPWKRKWQPTPVFLPKEFCGQRILVGYSLQGRKESDTTKWLTHSHRHTRMHTNRHLKIWLRPDNLLPRWHTLVAVGRSPQFFACSWQDALGYIWGKYLHSGWLLLTEWVSQETANKRKLQCFMTWAPRLSSPPFIPLVRSKSLSAAHTRGRKIRLCSWKGGILENLWVYSKTRTCMKLAAQSR